MIEVKRHLKPEESAAKKVQESVDTIIEEYRKMLEAMVTQHGFGGYPGQDIYGIDAVKLLKATEDTCKYWCKNLVEVDERLKQLDNRLDALENMIEEQHKEQMDMLRHLDRMIQIEKNK